MSYTINKSDGSVVTVADNTVDQSYYNPNANGAGKGVGTQLVGNDFAGFYQPMAQNFLQLTENFAGPNMPSDTTALQGQLWFKRNSAADGELYVRTNSLTAGGMTNWTGVVLNKPGAINGLLPPQGGQAGNVLSTNGTNPVWVPMGGYSLPIATTSTLGGVKVGSGLSISVTGELANTYTYILPKADYDTLGGVRVGNGLQVDGNGTISVIGGGGSSYTLPPATASVLGGIKVGSGLAITSDGTLSATGGGGGLTYSLATGTASGNSVPIRLVGSDSTVSTVSLEGGSNITVETVPSSSGSVIRISSTGGGGGYVLPPATASVLGGIKVGSGLSITSDGTLSATGGVSGVTQIVAGANVSISPSSGTGVVTINAIAGGGGVSSVGITSSDMTVTNSPITSSGNINLSLNTVPVVKGGTGLTSFAQGEILFGNAGGTLSKLSPGTAGQVLTTNGAGANPTWVTPGGGGYVLPTASATTLGGVKVGSNLNIDANGVLSVAGVGTVTSVGITSTDLTVSNSPVTSSGNITVNLNTVAPTKGGTGQTTYSRGDVLYSSSTNTLARLPIGTTGQVLTVDAAGLPVWAASGGGSGGVTQIIAGTGVTISPTGGTGAVTINATGGGGGSGTVTSVSGTGTVNGITLSGTVTSSGNLTLGGSLSGVSLSTQVTGTLPVANGGTGITTTPVNGAIDIGNGTGFTRTTLTAGSGISITNGSGSITISATGGGGGSGTVTSVGLTMPSGFTVGSSPVTSSGTIAVSTSLNGILAGNGSGFTTITVGSGLTYTGGTLSASGSSYILPPATASVLGGIKVGSGLAVTADGTLSVTGGGGGSGTVTSVGITSSDLSVSNSPITSSGNITLNLNTVSPTKGGTGQSAYTKGDLLYSAASNSLSRLPIGTTGQVLTVDATGVPVWAASGGGGGGVTQIIAGTGVTISPTGGTGAVTINATGGGGGSSDPAVVVFKYTAGGSGTFNSAGGAADVIVSQTGGVSAALTDPSNCIVTFTLTGRTTPPKSIMLYGQNFSANTFSIISAGLGANNVVAGGGTAASPSFISGFSSTNTVKLQLTMSATGASAGVGQRAHCMVVFGF